MTSDAWKSLIVKLLLMILTPLAAQLHMSAGPADLSAIATDLATVIVLLYGVYHSYGSKLVPHKSIAIDPSHLTATQAPVVGSHVPLKDGNGQIWAKVVGAILIGFVIIHPGGLVSTAQAAVRLPCDPMHLLPNCIETPASRALEGSGVIGGSSSLENIAKTLAKPFTDIANFIGTDATSAIQLSTAIPSLQDGHGQQCWMAMKQFGDVIKAHPVPLTFHVINDYETLRLLGMATNNLCSNVHCTQVFSDATAMAQAASPTPLAIPSLHDLCTKVPQIAVVAPIPDPTPTPSVSPTPTPSVSPTP